MKPKEREIIADKCNGRCAYCGHKLNKGWHVSKILSEHPIIDSAGRMITPNDNIENKIPSCAACNMSRTRDNSGVTFISIEKFREQIKYNLEFLKGFPYYHRAVRFGQIIETNIEIIFYFETLLHDKCRQT